MRNRLMGGTPPAYRQGRYSLTSVQVRAMINAFEFESQVTPRGNCIILFCVNRMFIHTKHSNNDVNILEYG